MRVFRDNEPPVPSPSAPSKAQWKEAEEQGFPPVALGLGDLRGSQRWGETKRIAPLHAFFSQIKG